MKRLEHMKESLMACVESQISGNLANVDAKELGEAVDMIKDLSEAIYYCTITEAMKEKEEKEEHHSRQPMYYSGGGGGNSSYYSEPMVHYNDRMYNSNNYGNTGNSNGNSSSTRNYHDMKMGHSPRDMREGSSPMYRRMYMESKEMNQDSSKTMHDLEKYMQELSGDVMEMIANATAEEKQMLRQKITTLATKIK